MLRWIEKFADDLMSFAGTIIPPTVLNGSTVRFHAFLLFDSATNERDEKEFLSRNEV